jgi:hypothetical protein
MTKRSLKVLIVTIVEVVARKKALQRLKLTKKKRIQLGTILLVGSTDSFLY